ncbi:MAG: type I glutamate--ammonia ligase [Ruminococcaceae bacterium]|nr:type I glutamate--ammonia ligase [Oscillospiraceae bacterium]
MARYTKADIIRMVEEQDVRFIRLQFTDIFGIVKNVAITPSQLDKALANECMFDGSSIEGFARIEESDMKLYPDLDTFVVFPWRPQQGKVARLICDVYTTDGKPFAGDPRHVLRRVIDEARDMGYDFYVGPECEFFLFLNDEQGKPTAISYDQGGYFDLEPIGQGEDVRREIVLALEDLGFEIEASHHECAPGQHEIDFRFDEAMITADNIQTFKMAVRSIARRYGMHATFMPKPIAGISGSGMHTNMSLFKDGQNVFYDAEQQDGLSLIAKNFIAGLINHIRGLCAVTNPLVNSYKRLVPGYEAPCYIAWSNRNRSPLIRIPNSRGRGTRIELRNPDPSCNPYLELALCLAAGLAGIKKNLQPPPPTDVNIYALSPADRKTLNIDSLPESLAEALDEMERDQLVGTVLGPHIMQKYLEAKRQEWDEYRVTVSPCELDAYLRKY